MEPRARTILPVVGVVLVIIIALVAFFVTRKVSNAKTAASPTPSAATASTNDLIYPAGSASPKPGTTTPPKGAINRVPNTGIEDQAQTIYTTAIDDKGFRDSAVRVPKGTIVAWLNLGSHSQTILINGQVKTIAPNQQVTLLVTQTQTITSPSTNTSQTVTAQ